MTQNTIKKKLTLNMYFYYTISYFTTPFHISTVWFHILLSDSYFYCTISFPLYGSFLYYCCGLVWFGLVWWLEMMYVRTFGLVWLKFCIYIGMLEFLMYIDVVEDWLRFFIYIFNHIASRLYTSSITSLLFYTHFQSYHFSFIYIFKHITSLFL